MSRDGAAGPAPAPAPAGAASPSGRSARGARVLTIGLDGATFDVLTPLMERGVMPALARLAAEGSAGPLRSVIPPTTAPAWVSFQTGSNPGKHGVLDFTGYDPAARRSWLVTARDAARPALWHLLSRAGRRVAVLNVPLTYPSAPVNGVLVPGIFAPPGSGYPAGVVEDLAKAAGGYEPPLLAGAYGTLGPRRFVLELTRRAMGRAAAAVHLLGRERWDFFMVHFQSVDSLQHMLWDRLQEFLGDGRDDAGVGAYFAALDAALARLLEAAQPEHTLVVSDHGFGPLHRLVFINEWLRREGWLTLRMRPGSVRAIALLQRLLKAADVVKVRRRLKLGQRERFAVLRRLGRETLINLDRSRAYAMFCSHAAHIYVNGALGNGQGYERTRRAVAESVMRLTDPQTRLPVFEAVHRREEVFTGDARGLPDLVAVPQAGYHVSTNLAGGRTVGRSTGPLCGDHRPDGVLFAAGRGIRRGVVEQARLVDVAPTILYLLDVPAPADMDGRVLTALFDPGAVAAHPPLLAEAEGPDGAEAADPGFSAEEMDAIQDHLRGLGYL